MTSTLMHMFVTDYELVGFINRNPVFDATGVDLNGMLCQLKKDCSYPLIVGTIEKP